MDIAEAKAKLDVVLDELAEAGFSVWGWDDESIQIGQVKGPSAECMPRHPADDPHFAPRREDSASREEP
jgi:hypothetical protein